MPLTCLLLALACTSKPDDVEPTDSGEVQDTGETGDSDDTHDTHDTALPDQDGDGVPPPADCDDADDGVYPGAPEICNSVDDDCDSLVDDADPDIQGQGTWFVDADGDGFGAAPVSACAQPTGSMAIDGDCVDTDADVWPGAPEDCDGADDDCDGIVDDACTSAPLGDLGAADAQWAVDGPCSVSFWGKKVLIADVDGDGLGDVVDGAWCDDVKNLLRLRGPIAGATTPDLDLDSLLRVASETEYLANFYTIDVNLDGTPELLTTYIGSADGLHLFFTPTLSMVPADADLTVTESSLETYGGVQVAAIPGSTGALVLSASWVGASGWGAGTWVVDADALGNLETDDLPDLGPEGGYAASYSAPFPDDAGDMNGDGDDDLFFRSSEVLDIYWGPISQSMGAREPDVHLADIYDDDVVYDGPTASFEASTDLNGDGLDDGILRGNGSAVNTVLVAYGSSDGNVAFDAESPLILVDDLTATMITPLDANGDGHIDLAVSAPTDDTTSSDAGMVYLEYGPFAGTRAAGEEGSARIAGEYGGLGFGLAMGAGDTNGDGFDDLAIGAQEVDGDPGTIWVFLGGP